MRAMDLEGTGEKRKGTEERSDQHKDVQEDVRRRVEKLAQELEESRDLSRIVVYLEVDEFYASIEMRDNQDLEESPVVVVSSSSIVSCNQFAKDVGINCATTLLEANRLRPDVRVFFPKFVKYNEINLKLLNIISDYDPRHVCPNMGSVYFDLTEYVLRQYSRRSESYSEANLWDEAAKVVQQIRTKILIELELQSKAGIAPNKLLSRMSANLVEKSPSGQVTVPCLSGDQVKEFIHRIPVNKFPGVSVHQLSLLSTLNIQTCGDLWDQKEKVHSLFGESLPLTRFLLNISLGIGENVVNRSRDDDEVKAIFEPTRSTLKILNKLKDLTTKIGIFLEKKHVKGKEVTLKLQKKSFTFIATVKSLSAHSSDFHTLYGAVIAAFQSIYGSEEIRAIYIRISNFNEEEITLINDGVQLELIKHEIQSSEPESGLELGEEANDVSEYLCINCYSSFGDSLALEMHLEECPTMQQSPGAGAPPSPSLCPIISSIAGNCSPIDSPANVCPLCSAACCDLIALNHHIDECLSRDVIYHMSQSTEEAGSSEMGNTPGNEKARKRSHERVKSGSGSGKKRSSANRSIDEFFSPSQKPSTS